MVTIPTLSEIYADVISDIETEFGSSVPTFGKVFLRAIALVQAGKLKIMYLILGKLQKNIFVDTADPEATGGTLERFGRVKLGRNPFAAVAGEYTITFTGTIGAIIPGETVWRNLVNNKLFIIEEDFELTSSPDTVSVRALEAGANGGASVGDGMVATSPITDVDQSATVTAEDVTAVDVEDIETYRDRIIEAFRLEPQGGAASDYRIWSEDVTGVQQVYAYAQEGEPANVLVFVEATEAASTDGKGTPSAATLSGVEDVFEQDPDTTKPLNERGRRPLGVFELTVGAVIVREVDITIDGYVGATATIQSTIEAALETAISNIRPFIPAADAIADQNDRLDSNKIISVILTAVPGSVFGTITLEIDSSPVSSFTFDNGEIPNLNSVTFT